MPLNAGNPSASEGLAQDIFQVLQTHLGPSLEESLDDPTEQLAPIEDAWRTLSYCIASGVVEHLVRDPAAEPDFAEAFSSSAQDADYWDWLSGFSGVFRTWAAASGTLAQLHAALNAFFATHPTPTQMTGVLR